ncbi:hypothetical protein GLYMA_13G205451v4 [Glycine max]|nr:hypothetical protein GLYMA_13G205451v4 [Glycine max]KAH1102501.1 hypothetical protein GYH30_036847 [Glycine max]
MFVWLGFGFLSLTSSLLIVHRQDILTLYNVVMSLLPRCGNNRNYELINTFAMF